MKNQKCFILQSKGGAHFEKVRCRAMCGEILSHLFNAKRGTVYCTQNLFPTPVHAVQEAEEASKAAEVKYIIRRI